MNYGILILTQRSVDAATLGHTLGWARDGAFVVEILTHLAAGLQRIERGGIDAILVDLKLADSRGMATLDRLFAAAPYTPIMTLDASTAEALETLEHGAQCNLARSDFDSTLLAHTLYGIIQRKSAEDALYKEKTRIEIVLNAIGDAVICTDVIGRIEYLNTSAERLLGWSREEACGEPIASVFQLISAITREPQRNSIEMVLQRDQPMGLPPHTLLIRRDGSEKAIEDSATPIRDWHGELTGAVAVFHDVSAARAMSLKMAHLAQHDFLTDLPNRVLLSDRIGRAIKLASRYRTTLAVLFLDLDNFKHINDSLGHATGDKLLQSVAQRLTACLRGADTISRLGGDEFVILVTEGHDEHDAALTASKVLAALNAPHRIGERDLHVSTSIGVSLYPADGEDAETLIMNADTAMYCAKERGRNNYQFFSSEMNIRAVERQDIEAGLRRALEQQKFVLHYQPIVDLDSGGIIGAEALLRWTDAERGLILPKRFVAIAEACGLIVPIGRWVLREACLQTRRWAEAGLRPIAIAVNISALEFRQPKFLDGVRDVLEESGLAPSLLQLEITESVLMRDAQASAAILQQLKHLGVQLAVDDFGTGYSSLSYLKQFPIDILKIDQSFVSDIGAASDEGIIVSAVINMASSLKKRVVAEGVETRAQLDFLRARHCSEGQGYFFSAALDADRFASVLAEGLPALPRAPVKAEPAQVQAATRWHRHSAR